ncbi:hypothetical protein C8J56DRAFT_1126654 [Mycena floridula]|nr:hypothetical protein C8J56DRAFT_1126654 [Mycena floridula]
MSISAIMTFEPFPDIPDDLCVRGSSHSGQLVLVARHVQEWIDPILYCAVELCTVKDGDDFLQRITTTKSPECFARHIRCSGLRIVALWNPAFASLLPMLLPTVVRLSLPAGVRIKYVLFSVPTSITHLQIKFALLALKLRYGIARLTQLQHISIRQPTFSSIRSFTADVIDHLPKTLQQILIALDPVYGSDSDSGSEDDDEPLSASWIIDRCDPRVVFEDQYYVSSADFIQWNVPSSSPHSAVHPDGGYINATEMYIWERASDVQRRIAAERKKRAESVICSDWDKTNSQLGDVNIKHRQGIRGGFTNE